MSKTKDSRYCKRKSLRKLCVRANEFYGGGSSLFERIEANIENAKQIRIQGQRLSNRDFVQANWGRVQAAATDEYARAFLVADTPAEFIEVTASSAELIGISHHGSIRTPQEPATSRERLATVLKEHLAGIVSAIDETWIRAIIVSLSEASDDHSKLHLVKQWLDDVENQNRDVEPPSKELPSKSSVLERLEGFVDQIEGCTAFVRLKSEHGDELYGEYPAADLLAKGITERRRFRCETIERDGQVHVSFEAIPERKAPADEDIIHRRIDELLADDELDGDY